ncbi:NAD(+) diphosphatase [Agaribacter flavus]|uniref:NAD(+) diphosphatase n=1 Tax=Agaribacter flavus TaxID=1902781 RepID=A0ABV7FT23_9ALTE
MHFVFADGKLVVPVGIPEENLSTALNKVPLSVFTDLQDQVVSFTSNQGGEYKFLDVHISEIDEEQWSLVGVRDLLNQLPQVLFAPIAQAWQYARFLKTHRYCGQCGLQMQRVTWEMATHCHNCHHRCYPRVSPCTIVSIKKGEQILLAKGVRHLSSGMFSTLAGFVESAESLEEATHREVFEEVGIKIKNLRYFGSQPWPFPHSLMCGFIADYDSGEINIDTREIAEAHWYDIDNLPLIPPSISIAGKLISATIEEIRQSQ